MSQSVNFDEILDPSRQDLVARLQLQIASKSPGMKRRITRSRDPVETRLLARAICDAMKKLEEEGTLEIDGRTWKFNF